MHNASNASAGSTQGVETVAESLKNIRKIDVHHHIIPSFYLEALEKAGIQDAWRCHGYPFPIWTPESSLGVMDRNNIQVALFSISSPGVYFGDAKFACDLARICNEFCASQVASHSDRFGFFATVPTPLGNPAVEEAVYALDTLKADGVALLASSGGHFLGHPELDPLMQELDRRNAVVYVHPNIHPSSQALDLSAPGFLTEFVFDTTRAVVNMVLSGVLERYPHIRWIVSHAGGVVPFIAWRLSLVDLMPDLKEKVPQGVLTYLRSLYFDTALSSSRYALGPVIDLAGTSQIVFGSDYPYAPKHLVNRQIVNLEQLDLFDVPALEALSRGNALQLFPRFGGL